MPQTRSIARGAKQAAIQVEIPASSRRQRQTARELGDDGSDRSVSLGRRKSTPDSETGSRQLRSDEEVTFTGTGAVSQANRKRRAAASSQAPRKQARISRETRSARPNSIEEDEEEDDDVETAPNNPAFYNTINRRSRGVANTSRANVDPYEFEESEQASQDVVPKQSQRLFRADELPKTRKEALETVAAKAATKADPSKHVKLSPSQAQTNAAAPQQDCELQALRDFNAQCDQEDDSDAASEDFDFPERFKVVLDIPEPGQAFEKVEVEPNGLSILVECAAKSGWARNSEYATTFPPSGEETEKDWWERQRAHLGTRDCQPLFISVIRLLRLLRGMTQTLNIEKRVDYLRDHRVTVEKSVGCIDAAIVNIVSSIEEAETGESGDRISGGVKAIHKTLVPLLVLCLKQAFLSKTHIMCMLKLMLLMCQWLEDLHGAVVLQYMTSNVATATRFGNLEGSAKGVKRNRERFKAGLDTLGAALQAAIERLEYQLDAPRRREEASKRDAYIKAERAEEARRWEEERQARLVPHLSASQATLAASSNAYYKLHGWHEREDLVLLDELRSACQPRLHTLGRSLPGRGRGALIRRISELRAMSWQFFADMGEEPPAWCYDDGWGVRTALI